MSKARANQHNQIDSIVWARINKKISPIQMTQLKKSALVARTYANDITKIYKMSDEAFSVVEKQGIVDWTNLYTKDTSEQFVQLMNDACGIPFDTKDPIKSMKETLQKDEKDFDKSFNEKEAKKRHHELIIAYRLFLLNSACLCAHSKGMHQLIEEARKGNDASLFKAITIDKTLIVADWVAERIRKEALKANQEFLKKLAQMINKKLDIRKTAATLRQSMFLPLAWVFGCHKLSDEEMCKILDKLDVCTTTPDALKITRHRLGLTHASLKKHDFQEMLQLTSPQL